MTDAKKHTVVFYWEGDGPEAGVQCPWEANDPERPCLMWADEDHSMPVDGCAVVDYLDAGYEAIGVEGRITSVPVVVEMAWNDGGEYPVISVEEKP